MRDAHFNKCVEEVIQLYSLDRTVSGDHQWQGSAVAPSGEQILDELRIQCRWLSVVTTR